MNTDITNNELFHVFCRFIPIKTTENSKSNVIGEDLNKSFFTC